MVRPLLSTKLTIPPPRPNLVARPRLINQLDEGLRLNRRLTLAAAPAGFGKTTLISSWVVGGSHPAAWLSLDESDSDPVQFLTYLVAALQQIDPRIGQATDEMLQSAQLPPLQSLVTALINDLTAAALELILVLDDYHLITSTPVQEMVEFLLEHQPHGMHLVIGTREDPPLPLAKLRARGQITEIRERDLRFTAEEAAAFLNQTMGLSLAREAVEALEARTEGWIAGLQLAALALQKEPDQAGAFITAFTGNDRYIMDYLVTEVLQRLPEPTREFLRQTAVLDRLSAPLCNALTGREDSATLLEQLETANLFLIPLDHRREWYRYHHLFAEFLRMTLDEQTRQQQHAQAVRWYEANGLPGDAIRHALACAALSRDFGDAERLIRAAAETTLHSGGILTLDGWLRALPDAHVRASAELATYRGWVLALTGAPSLAEDYAGAAEMLLERSDLPESIRGRLLALRAFIAVFGRQDYEHAIDLASRALDALEEDHPHWHVIALWAMAESLERTRSISEAIEAFREARRLGLLSANPILVAAVEMSLALSLNNHGRRVDAIRICEEAIERHTDAVGRLSPVATLILTRLGMLYYEADLLEESRQCFDEAHELGRQLAMGESFTFAQGLSAPTLYALGETDGALDALEKAVRLAPQSEYVDADWFLAAGASIRLRQGDLAFAQHWAATNNLSPDDSPQYLEMEQHLVYARLLLAESRLVEAQSWLARLESFAQERGLFRALISIYILLALAAERAGDRTAACEYLARAVQRAAPQGYLRAFMDEDRQVMALLPAVKHAAPAFVDELIAHARAPGARQRSATQPLAEPLSEREIEVLGLIAEGLNNSEIAQRLYIAVGTVKRHINNIYGKLDVTSRTQAVARARQLSLLDD